MGGFNLPFLPPEIFDDEELLAMMPVPEPAGGTPGAALAIPQPQPREPFGARPRRGRAFLHGLQGQRLTAFKEEVERPLTKGELALGILGAIMRGAAVGVGSSRSVPYGASGFGAGVSQGLAGGLDDATRQQLLSEQRQQQKFTNALRLEAAQRQEEALGLQRQPRPFGQPFEAVDQATGKRVLAQRFTDGSVRPVEGFQPTPERETSGGSVIFRPTAEGDEEQAFRLRGLQAEPILSEETVPFRLGPAPLIGDLFPPRQETRRVPFTRPVKKAKPVIRTMRGPGGVERDVLVDPETGELVGETPVERQPRPTKPRASDRTAKQAAQIEDTAADALTRAGGDPDAAIRLVDAANIPSELKAKIRGRIRERVRPGKSRSSSREQLLRRLREVPVIEARP